MTTGRRGWAKSYSGSSTGTAWLQILHVCRLMFPDGQSASLRGGVGRSLPSDRGPHRSGVMHTFRGFSGENSR